MHTAARQLNAVIIQSGRPVGSSSLYADARLYRWADLKAQAHALHGGGIHVQQLQEAGMHLWMHLPQVPNPDLLAQ